MRFKTGMLVGFTTGYVLGTKAGKQRYEQIVRAYKRLKSTSTFQTASEKFGAAVELSIERGKLAAVDGIHRATHSVRKSASNS